MDFLTKFDSKTKILMPVSKFMILWYFIVMLIMIADFYFTVFFICFHSKMSTNIVNYITLPLLLLICVMDIGITLNTSFIQRGRIITEKKIVRLKYVRSLYFVFDFLALIIVMFQLGYQGTFQRSLFFFNFFPFIKIFKVSKFDTLIQMYVIQSKKLQLGYQIVKYLILLVLVCHIIGSFFFYLDMELINLGWYEPEQLWIYNSYAHTNIVDLPIIWQYGYSFYYAIITLSGTAYGDLTPLNQTQVVYTCFTLALPMIVYAYLFSAIYKLIGEGRTNEIKRRRYRKAIKNYFKEFGMDLESTIKFINYLSFAYEKKNSINNQYLSQLAPSLKTKYTRYLLDNNFDFTIFNNLTTKYSRLQDIKKIIYETSEEEPYTARYVFNVQKNKNLKLYYIVSGEISEYIHIRKQKVSKSLKERDFFCQYAFYTGVTHAHSNHLFEANDFTVCQTIDYTKFREKLRENPLILQAYFNLRNKILFQNQNRAIKTRCFFCEYDDHIVDKCPKLRINIDPIQSISKSNQNRVKFQRRNRVIRKYYYFCRPLKLLGNLFMNRNSQITYEQKSVQISQQEFAQYNTNEKSLRNKIFEVVENWKNFAPLYSFN